MDSSLSNYPLRASDWQTTAEQRGCRRGPYPQGSMGLAENMMRAVSRAGCAHCPHKGKVSATVEGREGLPRTRAMRNGFGREEILISCCNVQMALCGR